MRRFITYLLLGLLCRNVMQSQGIVFMDNLPVAEVLAKADAEGKMVFVDCYTSWCVPCKKLANDVFPQKEVGDFFNPRFVSLKLDMEKGEGPEMAKKWDVNVYPTLMFLDAKGEVLFQTVGARDGRQLVDTVAFLLENHRPTEIALRYKNGDRSAEVVAEYIAELRQQRKRNTVEAVADEFVANHREELLSDTLAQRILVDNVSDPFNEGFLYAYGNRGQLPAEMNEAMEYVWKLHTKSFYLTGENGGLGLDEDGMNTYHEFMKQNGVEQADEYYYSYKLPASFLMKDKRMILECLEGCRNLARIARGQIDMAFKALDELELTDVERLKADTLRQYYSSIINKESK